MLKTILIASPFESERLHLKNILGQICPTWEIFEASHCFAMTKVLGGSYPVDLIFMDWNIPASHMDAAPSGAGMCALLNIEQAHQGIPVILLTNDETDRSIQHATTAGYASRRVLQRNAVSETTLEKIRVCLKSIFPDDCYDEYSTATKTTAPEPKPDSTGPASIETEESRCT